MGIQKIALEIEFPPSSQPVEFYLIWVQHESKLWKIGSKATSRLKTWKNAQNTAVLFWLIVWTQDDKKQKQNWVFVFVDFMERPERVLLQVCKI